MSVYYVHAPDLGLVKIGFAKEPKSRFGKIQSDCPTRLILLATEDGGEIIEAARHRYFADYRARGEWFRYEGELRAHIAALPPAPVKAPSLNSRLVSIGVSKAHASQILSGKYRPSLALAIRIFRETGWRAERIANLTDEQIAIIESAVPWTPRQAA